jgi:hypothetical protein
MDNSPIVYGYHGTSQTKAANILKHGFLASDNDYDWLGTGIYFFQDAPIRAKQWATQQHPNDPAVLRASIHLNNCIDLFDIGWQPLLKNLYNPFVEQWRTTNKPLPRQNPDRFPTGEASPTKAHRLDCFFLNYSIELLSRQDFTIESVRAAFIEGERLFPDSAIFDLTHVQIAIGNPTLIKTIELIEPSGVIKNA